MAIQETILVLPHPDLNIVVADLHAKREELSMELNEARAVFDRIQGEIRAVDTVLRLFGAGEPLHQAEIPLHRRDVSKVVLFALRTSPTPLTSLELAKILLAERRMSPHDKKLMREVGPRVRATLRHFRKQGLLTSFENAEGLLTWRYADQPKSISPRRGARCKQ